MSRRHIGAGLCIGIGGVRVDRAVAARILEAVSNHAVEAAIHAAEQVTHADNDARHALSHELEDARYEVALAARRYDAVDPSERLVARELEARWNAALERVGHLQERLTRMDAGVAGRPPIDRAALMAVAHDLPAAWNAPSTNARTKQRLTRLLIQEVVIDLDESSNELS
jgi:hypothetical protein